MKTDKFQTRVAACQPYFDLLTLSPLAKGCWGAVTQLCWLFFWVSKCSSKCRLQILLPLWTLIETVTDIRELLKLHYVNLIRDLRYHHRNMIRKCFVAMISWLSLYQLLVVLVVVVVVFIIADLGFLSNLEW